MLIIFDDQEELNIPVQNLLTEAGDNLITESGDNLIVNIQVD
jgi:hypothetical protein